MSKISLLKILVQLIFLNIVKVQSFEDLMIYELNRHIDLQTALIKIETQIIFYNNGSNSIRRFEWFIENHGILTYIDAFDSDRRELKVKASPANAAILFLQAVTNKNSTYYNVYFFENLMPYKSKKVAVRQVYAKGLVPLPSEIMQSDDQFIVYEGNIFLQTRYYVVFTSTYVALPNNDVESYTKDNSTVLKNKIISYGPYKEITPFKLSQKLRLHYKSNDKFFIAPEVKRKIRISPWGTIFVEEEVTLIHTGAKLKGPFHAIIYRESKKPANSVEGFNILLPASAKYIDFDDNIGNIWNWASNERDGFVIVNFKTRFILVGGWKIVYRIKYQLPLYEQVYKNLLMENSDIFTLKIKFVDYIFEDMFIEKIKTQVELPHLANIIGVRFPYTVESLPAEYRYLPFDICHILKPRQILTFTKTNLVENHIKDFEIKFQWNPANLFFQPLLFALFLFTTFVCVIIYVRLDFSLDVNDKKSKSGKNIGSGDLIK